MSIHAPRQVRRSVDGLGRRRHATGWVRRVGAPLLVAAPAAWLALAAGFVGHVAEPAGPGWILASAVGTALLLWWLIIAVGLLLEPSDARRRPVFPARRSACCGVWLVAVAAALAAALVSSEPFDHVSRSFEIGAAEVIDAGLVAAIVVTGVAGPAALLEASEQRREERAWPDHMPRR